MVPALKAFLETPKEAVVTEGALEATLSAGMQAPRAVVLSTTRVARLTAQVPRVCPNFVSSVLSSLTRSLQDIPGVGGASTTGDATGGDARKRAYNSATAGGNAQTGDSSSTSSGTVYSIGDSDGEVTNTNSSKCL